MTTPQVLVAPIVTNTTAIVAKSKVVELSNGNILVTYISERGGDPDKDGFFIHGQQFDALGNKIGGEMLFEFPEETDTENFDIVALPEGRVAILADQDSRRGANPNNDDPFLGVFQVNGSGTATFLPGESEDASGTGTRNFDFALTERGDDGWMAHSLASDFGADRIFQDSDIQGVELVERTGFRGTRNGELESTTLENGTQVLLLDRDARDNRDGDLEFRIIGLSSNVVKSDLVGGDADDRNNEGTVQALKGGGFVIAWTERDADTDVVFKMFDASGDPLSASVTFVGSKSGTTDNNNEPAIAALQDGGFIIFFDDDTSGGGIKGQRYDDQGGAVGEIFTVFPSTFPEEIDATLLSNGNVAVSFTIFNTIHTTIVSVDGDLPDGAIVGTGGNDTLTGTRDDDVIFGLGGDDTMSGENGDDTLDGGAGDDRVIGNRGNDILRGGAGDDRLQGFAQRDTLDGGTGNDRLSGGTGSDTFIFRDGDGRDEITDFNPFDTNEKIDLSDVTAITSFADLQANHLVQGDQGAEIDDGRDLTIILTGVDIADLEESSFIF
ncbi:hypothetical protein [uncultured Roseobacter sp.]|uniref:calcium-binding protein n=1 Tax=uncultured Roseobacter sp. TaxID=114847 RepID=UPI00260FF947|nr:hypothetical protein [uncultured Roseobacter sp.]